MKYITYLVGDKWILRNIIPSFTPVGTDNTCHERLYLIRIITHNIIIYKIYIYTICVRKISHLKNVLMVFLWKYIGNNIIESPFKSRNFILCIFKRIIVCTNFTFKIIISHIFSTTHFFLLIPKTNLTISQQKKAIFLSYI
jgi:hypothetical protein